MPSIPKNFHLCANPFCIKRALGKHDFCKQHRCAHPRCRAEHLIFSPFCRSHLPEATTHV